MPKIINDERVYEAVIRIIIEHGYDGATTKKIAEAAGMSEVTLFRKYGSKLQLVRNAIAYIMTRTNMDPGALYTGDVRKDLMRMVEIFQESVVKHGNFILVLFTEMFHHPELAEVVQNRQHISETFARVIARYQEEGVLKKEDPMHAVFALVGPLMLSSLLSIMIPNQQVESLDPEQHVDYFLQGRRSNN